MPRAFRPCVRLGFTVLEDRLAPALTFQFDYSLDSSGFFSNPEARSALERAGAQLSSRIASTPAAITPTAGQSWQAIFTHPNTQDFTQIDNLSVPAGTLIVFAGGMSSTGPEAGIGGPGGYSVVGSSSWQQIVATRGLSGFSTWGGSIAFDVSQNWHFDSDITGIANNEMDFQSVAVHELAHVLGFGTSTAFTQLLQGNYFTGTTATAIHGAPPQIEPGSGHWAQGTLSGGEPVSMQPIINRGSRVDFTALDFAALNDIGWQVTGLPGSRVPPETPPTVTPEPLPIQVPLPAGPGIVAVAGPTNGNVQLYSTSRTGTLTGVGTAFRPFAGFDGAVRAVTADVNDDGVQDIIVGTGPGGGSRIRVLDGRTYEDLIPAFSAFEESYRGGVFLAAGDLDGDGRPDLVVTPDQGGGPRVRVLALEPSGVTQLADFYGIDDPNFRGGARSAIGDLNGDGRADLVVSAGFGGGPRVSIYDGTSVPGPGNKVHLTADFFAFEPTLRNGVYLTIGDINGDRRGDLIFGAGPGGGPRVLALSGATLTTLGASAALTRPLADVFAGDLADRGGVRVTAKSPVDGEPTQLITGNGSRNELRVYRPTISGLVTSSATAPFPGLELDGVYVG